MQPTTTYIDRVEFAPLSKQEILTTVSKVLVDIPSTTVTFGLNGTLHDLRMGAIFNLKCATCDKGPRECPGHFGHTELCVPILNPNYIKTILTLVLREFCMGCHRAGKKRCMCKKPMYLRMTSHTNACARVGTCPSATSEPDEKVDSPRPLKKRRLTRKDDDNGSEPKVKSKLKSKPNKPSAKPKTRTKPKPKAAHSSTLIESLLYDTSRRTGVKLAFRDPHTNEPINLRSVYDFVAAIPREEYLRIFPHFKQFENLADVVFIHVLPILPITARYPNSTNNVWYSNSLTQLYANVIKKNIQLKNALSQPNLHRGILDEYVLELQDAVNVLYDVKNTSRSLRPKVAEAGGIRQLVDGKRGRIRGNLMGKRVDFCCRSVLSGDPALHMNEVGLPKSVCENLTVPFVVNVYNIAKLEKWNIRYVTKRTSARRFDASLMQKGALRGMIEVGDTVERSLIDGDLVAVNRQPSLHRASMNAMRVRVFNCNTIRLSYNSLPGLAADCDGDEINVFVPQDHESRAELEELFMLSTSIVSSQSSKPILGLTQDSLLGVYLLSKATLSPNDFWDILYKAELKCDTPMEPSVLKPHASYTGLQLVNYVLLELDIYLGLHYDHGGVIMRDGLLVQGLLTKATLGIADKSLIHLTYLRYGHKKAAKFMFHVQRVADHFLDKHGFSVGVGDCMIDHEPLNYDGVDQKIKDDLLHAGKPPDELALCAALNTVTQIPCDDPEITNSNSLLAMIQSGSKGSIVNFNQITRHLGQQFSDQGRLQPGLSGNTRILPHQTKFDYSLEARGFVRSSFVKGLSPVEFWNHSTPSRITMIDTSCKTSVTGDQQRRLVKSLEKLITRDAGDGHRLVKNMVTGAVIQFNYGEDGLDGTYMRTADDL